MRSSIFPLRRVPLLLGLLALPAAAQSLVELRLAATLDEPRGYCIDMIGHKERARIDRPVHAHTCYAYQGAIAVDQGMDAGLLRDGRFRFPRFDVCLQPRAIRADAPLVLGDCADTAARGLRLEPDGRLVTVADPALCVTVADGAGAEGGGGDPVHLRRALRLAPCADDAAIRQRWSPAGIGSR